MWKFFSISFILVVLFMSCQKKTTPISNIINPTSNFSKGADVSWITEMESAGVKFYSTAGKEMECMALLKSLGMNTIRLRVWVNPSPLWNDVSDVVVKALRAKQLGMRLLIDFHYSDSWADPGQQHKPAAWESLNFDELKLALANHTKTTLATLKQNGISPEWVQVGNETNDGMLWPDGRASTSMNNFTQLINAGYDAVKEVFPTSKVIVHISNGWDKNLFQWMFAGLKTNGAKFDVIGMSLYPTASNWASYNQQCFQNMNDMVSLYNKEVFIVEVGMPSSNVTECNSFLSDIIDKTKHVTSGKGLGVLYWEPQAYNGWKGYELGAFDIIGKPTNALLAFSK